MSFALMPRFSPLIVTLVPGGPSLGDKPVTLGASAFDRFMMKTNSPQTGQSTCAT